MRKGWALLLFGFLPAVTVALAVFVLGLLLAPPQCTVRGVFNIDWSKMPYVPEDKEAEKVRIKWRESIIQQMTQKPPVDEIADALATSTGSNRQTITARLNQGLRVSVAHDGDDNDRFIVGMQDSDTNFAASVVRVALNKYTSSLRQEAKAGSVVASLRSGANIGDIEANKEELTAELSRLQLQNEKSYSAERERRCNQIRQELDSLEFDHATAGFSLLGNLANGALAEPVTIVEQPTVVKRVSGYGLIIVGISIVMGAGVGTAGFVLYTILFAPRRFKPPVLAPERVAPPILR